MLIKRKSIEAESNTKQGPHASSRPKKSYKPKFAPVTLSELEGVRYLHFGTPWVQGAMRIRKPDWPELEYSQQMMLWMLFQTQPNRILQLGLGTGALTKFCYRQYPDASITAVELNPDVIQISRSMFKLPPEDERLQVLEMDAMQYITDPAHRASADVLQVDLYDATARGPVLDTPEFYQACFDALTEQGIMTVNLFGDHPSYAKNIKAIQTAFKYVYCLPEIHDGNVIAAAFKNKPEMDFTRLYERAKQIQTSTKIPTKAWVNGLKEALQHP